MYHPRGRTVTRRAALMLVAALVGFAIRPRAAHAADFSRYQPGRLDDVVATHPAAPGLVINQDVPIRTVATYLKQFRELPDDSRRLVRRWSESMNVPGLLDAFTREVRVQQDGADYWLPVQESLVGLMERELRPGEVMELFVIYIGQVDGRRLYLVNAFDHDGIHDRRR